MINALFKIKDWQKELQQKYSVANLATVLTQRQHNGIIPEKVHKAITVVIQKMLKGMVLDSKPNEY